MKVSSKLPKKRKIKKKVKMREKNGKYSLPKTFKNDLDTMVGTEIFSWMTEIFP